MSNIIAPIIALAVLAVLCGVTFAVAHARGKRVQADDRKDNFIVRLENTDCSIRDATDYLKLTNCLDTDFKPSERR